MHFVVATGGKRALLTTLWTPARIHFSLLRRFVAPITHDFQPDRLVFVCSGNICRSPFAEQLAKSHGHAACSMGLRADPGVAADPVAKFVATQFGVSLAHHRARQFDPEAISRNDLVIGFEVWHALAIEQLIGERSSNVRLVGAFSTAWNYHIQDPYGLPEVSFRCAFERVERCIVALDRVLRRKV
jgi:protein-tyrosine phosphatase